MRTLNAKTAGLLFLAASAVYIDSVNVAGAARPANSPAPQLATEVTLLEASDPFADVTEVGEPESGAAATQPNDQQGTSVSDNDVKVSDAGTVEIHVNEASLVEVLRMLSLQSQKNIIASKEVRGTVTANLYDVTVREALDAILHANGFAYREQGNFIYVYTAKEMAEIEKANRVMHTEVFRLYYTPAVNAVNMIKPVLSAQSQTAVTTPPEVGVEKSLGDLGGDAHAGDDMLVVTDYPENLEKVRNILKEVDRRPQQILVEATIVRAALREDNALGVDFTILGGVDFSGLSAVGSSTGDALNGNILNQGAAGDIVDAGYTGAGTGFTNGVPNGGLKVGVVYNDIAIFLSALEQVTDTIVMANPKVLALNKQVAEVHVGNNDGYLTTTTTESATVQTVEFLETGTKLMFRPFIGDDGFIRMEVHPEDSNGGLSPAGLPFKSTTEVTSQVMVKDGHTIVIGGLFRESTTSARSQVPGLGNIPFAGVLFRNQRDQTQREEVIILLTPHIVKDQDLFAELSAAELEKVEKLRVGLRKGMMFFGRERLAESSYETAVAELEKPNPDRQKALWHLNCATNLNPKFIEAIELKEQITGKEIAAVDNSSVRYFVKHMILNDTVVPSTQPVAADFPATQPANEVMVAAPATQPFVAADAPTTQPLVAANPTTQPLVAAEAPATQPVGSEVAATEAAPSTQPVAAVDAEVTPVEAITEITEITEVFSTKSDTLSEESESIGESEIVEVVEIVEDQPAPTTAPVVELENDFIIELPSSESESK